MPEFIIVNTTDTSIYLEWSLPENSGHTISNFTLQKADIKESVWKSSEAISMYNWSNNQPSIFSEIERSDGYIGIYWQEFSTIYSGLHRRFSLDLCCYVYMFRVQANSLNCLSSLWSSPIVLYSKQKSRAVLETRGTGKYNNLPAYIKLNGKVLFESNEFRGLHLIVLHRYDLSVISSETFNTFDFTSKSLEISNRILSLNSLYLVVLVSGYGWEKSMTKDLAYALRKMGASLIRTFGASTPEESMYYVDREEDYFHPYSFVGMPGVSNIQGTNFETLRSNTGYYNYDPYSYNALPTADLKVILTKDNQRLFYFPDTINVYKKIS